MSTLTIRTQNQNNTTTTIENTFIDTYMPRANGEFVKVYLYLIRIMNDPSCSITLSKIADALEHTEKDILRSLSYWHREGLLNVTLDHNQSVTAIDIIPLDSIVTNGTNAKRSEQVDLLDGNPTTILPTIGADDLTPKYTAAPEPVNALKSRQDFKQILFITEHGKV